MSQLALSASFEYLCYGTTAIIHIFTLTVRGLTLNFRRQILTSKVDPRAIRVKVLAAWFDSYNNRYRRLGAKGSYLTLVRVADRIL